MKKVFLALFVFLLTLPLFASWEETLPPSITGVESGSDDPLRLYVYFDFETSTDSGEKAVVHLYDSAMKEIDTKTVGKSRKNEKKAFFTPSSSGTYFISVDGIRGEEKKTSEIYSIQWSYPLFAPVVEAMNEGEAMMTIAWNPIKEADCYSVTIDGEVYSTSSTSLTIGPLEEGIRHEIVVSALRGSECVSSLPLFKTSRRDRDREWKFTYFGQSVKSALNKCTVLDSDDISLYLSSCSVTGEGDVSEKGGKFTSFHDGISYYYTVIDAERENFTLSARFTVDFINPTPDGQEGFGIVAMDSLGEYGVSSSNHYTNSASLIATKFEGWIDGIKYSSKDTLGSRFVTGITPEVLMGGDGAIAEEGKCATEAYSYSKDDLIEKGKDYYLTLSLDNTGFRAILNGEEHILYGGREALTVLDEDHIYVGFAVARGCNVTVSDVTFTVSDPLTDPPGEAAPPEYVPYSVKLESPSCSGDSLYKFTLSSISDGEAFIENKATGELLVSSFPVKAGVDVNGFISLCSDVTDIKVTFTPDPSFVPRDGAVMARWNDKGRLEESLEPIVFYHRIERREIAQGTIYVSPEGRVEGDGTREKPLDLYSAIRFSMPGSEIVMLEGRYIIDERLKIERGNNGTRINPKHLRGEGEVILDFSSSSYGMELWGDWWILSSFTVYGTPDGKKGLQIAGSHNVVRSVVAEFCGDTGIQISGSSSDSPNKWPKDNRVEYCVSHDNADKAMNNADGFAAKLTVGDGNSFFSCVAYANADDGWDLFSKIETGPIGAVTIEKCVAFSNGRLSDGRSGGDGNGFKLGGDGIAVAHTLKDSISFSNLSNGVTSNSNPSCRVLGVISWNNWGSNITLYGKGSGERNFVLEDVLSIGGGAPDNILEMPSLLGEDTYLWNGKTSSNSLGEEVDDNIFISTHFLDFTITDEGVDLGDFLSLRQ